MKKTHGILGILSGIVTIILALVVYFMSTTAYREYIKERNEMLNSATSIHDKFIVNAEFPMQAITPIRTSNLILVCVLLITGIAVTCYFVIRLTTIEASETNEEEAPSSKKINLKLPLPSAISLIGFVLYFWGVATGLLPSLVWRFWGIGAGLLQFLPSGLWRLFGVLTILGAGIYAQIKNRVKIKTSVYVNSILLLAAHFGGPYIIDYLLPNKYFWLYMLLHYLLCTYTVIALYSIWKADFGYDKQIELSCPHCEHTDFFSANLLKSSEIICDECKRTYYFNYKEYIKDYKRRLRVLSSSKKHN